MTKEEIIKIFNLIEIVYPAFIVKSESISFFLKVCHEINYEKMLQRLKTHIRISPYPPSLLDLVQCNYEKRDMLKVGMIQTSLNELYQEYVLK